MPAGLYDDIVAEPSTGLYDDIVSAPVDAATVKETPEYKTLVEKAEAETAGEPEIPFADQPTLGQKLLTGARRGLFTPGMMGMPAALVEAALPRIPALEKAREFMGRPLVNLRSRIGLDAQTLANAVDVLANAPTAPESGPAFPADIDQPTAADIQERMAEPSRKPTMFEQAAAGVQRGVISGVEALETPANIGALGASKALTGAASKALMTYFTAEMVKAFPELAKQFVEAWQKGDAGGVAESMTNAGINAAFIKTAVSQLKGSPDALHRESPQVLQPVQTQPVEGAGKVPVAEGLEKAGERGEPAKAPEAVGVSPAEVVQLSESAQTALDKLNEHLDLPVKTKGARSQAEAFDLGDQFKTPEEIAALQKWHDEAVAVAKERGAKPGADKVMWQRVKQFADETLQGALKPADRPLVQEHFLRKQAEQVAKMSPDEFYDWAHQFDNKGGFTPIAYRLGAIAAKDPALLESLKARADEFEKRGRAALEKEDVENLPKLAAQAQFFKEAWQYGAREGSGGEARTAAEAPAKPAAQPAVEPAKPQISTGIKVPRGVSPRAASQQFDSLVMEHGLEQGWVTDPGALYAQIGKGGDTASVKAKIAKSKALTQARRNAAIAMGLDPGSIDTVAGRAKLLDQLKAHIEELKARDTTEPEGTDAGFLPPEPTLPKVRQMENQGDLLSKQQEPFALVGEKGADVERVQREKEQAAKTAAEAKAAQAKQQLSLAGIGIVPHPGVASTVKTAVDWVRNIPQRGKVMLAQLAGKSAPVTSTASVESGNVLVHYASARIAAPTVAKSMATDVLGSHHKDPAFSQRLGAVLVEDRLRAIREALIQAGKQDEADKVGTVIGKAWSPLKSNAEFHAALRDAEIRAAIERHKATVQPAAQLAHEEAGGQLAGPGLSTGAFVNLKAILEGIEEKLPSGAIRGNLENPLRRLSRFFRQAKGTAGRYEVDYRTLAERMVSANYEEAAKRQMYKQLADDGLAVINDPGDPRPEIGGKPAVKFTIERRGLPAGEGKARTYIKNLWVRPDIAGEVRQALNTDGAVGRSGLAAAANLINRIQLAGPTDAVWHTANMIGSIAGSQGGRSVLADLARKVPGVNLADAIGRTVQSGIRVLRDNPEVQRDLAKLAEIGALRGQHPAGPMGRMIQFIDKAGRLVRNDLYDNLVKRGLAEGSEAGRREFVNQMGQYNGRLMGQFQRFFKEAGFSPFIVAGRNFNRMAMRRMTLDPGVKAASPAAAAEMRAIEAFGTIATLFAVPAFINYMLSGNSRPDLKMGQIGTGKKDSEGKEIVIDPAQWTGLRRGLRISGAQAVIEGVKRQEGGKAITRTAAHDILGGIMHPWTGPAPTALTVGATGYDPRFYKESVDTKDVGENVKAALKQLNPVAKAIIESREKDTTAAGSMAKQLGGAAGIKTVRPGTARDTVAQLHSAWKRTNPDPKVKADYERRQKEEFVSDYKELDQALRSNNEKTALKAIGKLQETHSDATILKRMNPQHKDGTVKPLFQENNKLENEFLDTLTLQQYELYEKARIERDAEYEKFLSFWEKRP